MQNKPCLTLGGPPGLWLRISTTSCLIAAFLPVAGTRLPAAEEIARFGPAGVSSEVAALPAVDAKTAAALTLALGLTVSETEMFLPIYSGFAKKREEQETRRRQLIAAPSDTPAEADALADQLNFTLIKQVLLLKELHLQIREALPAQKVIAFYRWLEAQPAAPSPSPENKKP